MKHVLALVNRRLAEKPTPAAQNDQVAINEQKDKQELADRHFFQPLVHITGQKWLYDHYCKHKEEGLVIWFISFVRYKNTCLPPSIDARLQIDRAFTSDQPGGIPEPIQAIFNDYKKTNKVDKSYLFVASTDEQESYFLPWYNSLDLLSKFTFEPNDSTAQEWSGRVAEWAKEPKEPIDLFEYEPLSLFDIKPDYSQIPKFLQTSRKLPANTSDLLEEYSERVRSLPLAFISYRWDEATPIAALLTDGLSTCQITAWWDRWSMPRQVSDNGEQVEANSLSDFLNAVLTKAHFSIALHTPTYNTVHSPFTQQEYSEMSKLAQEGELKLIDVPKDVSSALTLPLEISTLKELEKGKLLVRDTLELICSLK